MTTPDRASLVRVIESTKKGWWWCAKDDDFFDPARYEYGDHVGIDGELLDAIVEWATPA